MVFLSRVSFFTLLNVFSNLLGLHGEPIHEAITRINSMNSSLFFKLFLSIISLRYTVSCKERRYGHENEMYKEPMNLKRGKDVCMRELRECGGRTENKTKCAKG